MISYGIVIFFLLGIRAGALEEEMMALHQVDVRELGEESMDALSENYDVSNEIEITQKEDDQLIMKTAPDYVRPRGRVKVFGEVRCFAPKLCFYISNEPAEPFRYCWRMYKGICTYYDVPKPRYLAQKCTPYRRLYNGRNIWRTICNYCNKFGGCVQRMYICNGFKKVKGVSKCNYKTCLGKCKGKNYTKQCKYVCK